MAFPMAFVVAGQTVIVIFSGQRLCTAEDFQDVLKELRVISSLPYSLVVFFEFG